MKVNPKPWRSGNGAAKAVLLASAAATLIFSLVETVHAQDTGGSTGGQEFVADSSQLQDIVVTAQKRSQNVQEIPLAVTALSGAALASQGITTVQELGRVDPTLQIGQASGIVTTFIRGIGNPVTTAGNEASVPVYIDDVYFVRAAYPFFDLISVDRVEVLKGPQGTLFGRNASGGVINIATRDPSFSKPEVEARLGYSSYETVDAKLYANVPLSDTVAANVALGYHNQHEGWGRNRTFIDPLDVSKGYNEGGEDIFRSRNFTARAKLLWEAAPTTRMKLVGYYEDSWSSIGLVARPFPGTIGGTPASSHSDGAPLLPGMPSPSQVRPPLDFYDAALGVMPFDKSHGGGVSLRIDQELGFADLVSITGYRKVNERYVANGVNAPYVWLIYDLDILDKQFSQEFQLKSQSSSKINWILGLYYLNADGGFDPTTIRGPAQEAQSIQGIDLVGKQKVKSYAAFGQITYPITDMTNITAGLRYTIDKVEGAGTTTIRFLPSTGLDPVIIENSPPGGFSKTFKKPTWKIGVDHHLNDDIMAYANYSRGYKAGTHNTLPLDSPALEPEVVDAYEVGLKTEVFDKRLRVNIAGFWNDISNPQVQSAREGFVFLRNAGTARTKGVEFDITARVASGLTARFAGSYLDAKFRDFPNAPAYFYDPAEPGNLLSTTVNANGHWMPYASKWKFNGGVNYERNISDFGEVSIDVNANWSDKFYWEADNVNAEPSHLLLDAAVSFTPDAFSNLSFRLWAKNLTKEKVNINYQAFSNGSAYDSAPGAPRTIGAELIFNF